MLRNYIKIAWRHLVRHKAYTFINIIGLGVGLAACIIIGLWVSYELSYDDYHERSDRIYRVLSGSSAATQPPLAPALEADHPDLVKEAVRFWPIQAPADLVYNDEVFTEELITYTDPSIFQVFSHPLVVGNPETALSNPNSIVLSESIAAKFFGTENPIGKTMNMWGKDLKVTGVFEDVPNHSHHRFNALVPMERLRSYMGKMMDNWNWNGFYTYVLLNDGITPGTIETAFPSLYAKYAKEDFPEARLQPLGDIYFNPQDKDIGVASGNINYVYILTTIAFFVLIVACVNFMNLSTAYSSLRSKEVGMRKTLGAHRLQLVGQFLGEAIMLSLLSMAVALILVEVTLPFFSDFTGNPLVMPYRYGGFLTISGLIGFALLVGVMAGSYPAFYLSRSAAGHTLKGNANSSSAGISLRKGLVVFQFIISTFLIIAVITVFTQLRFMQNKDLGFNEEQVVVLEAKNYPLLRDELQKVSGVASVSAAYNVPGQRFPFYPVRTETTPADSLPVMRTLRVNPGFIETMGMNIVIGRSFDEEKPTDLTSAFIINRAAMGYLGWDEPLGKKMEWHDFSEDGTSFEMAKEGQVIGVVEDFNYASLHNPIEPLIIHLSQEVNSTVVRLRPGQTAKTLAQIKETWNAVSPESNFGYYFLDQELEQQYGAEEKLGTVFGGLTMLALFIACLGLFGLATFSTRQRTKEIGIRKVLGATITTIVGLLSKDFLKMVSLGFIIAVPIAWYAMNRWLADFAYKIEIGPGIFLLAGGLALLIALATVSWQSIRAALVNPVESLRSD
jgi:putative ABC transport system permease protein